MIRDIYTMQIAYELLFSLLMITILVISLICLCSNNEKTFYVFATIGIILGCLSWII